MSSANIDSSRRPIVLETRDVKKYFPVKTGLFVRSSKFVKAVDGVSLQVLKGETLGVVGESGCGKSTLGRLTLALLRPSGGSIKFDGADLSVAQEEELRRLRRHMQIVFQDTLMSFNPRKTIRLALSQPFRIHERLSKSEVEQRISILLETVGLVPATQFLERYPHELSGGQRQRVALARALALNPKYVVFDEAVSALDLSVRGQILNLLKALKKQFNLSSLFITHDLAVVRSVTDRVAVMYLGELVELAEVHDLYLHPIHPYTQALLSATPIPDPRASRHGRIVLRGDVPSPIDVPSGCRFHTRCPYSDTICRTAPPEWRENAPNHFVACHFAERFT